MGYKKFDKATLIDIWTMNSQHEVINSCWLIMLKDTYAHVDYYARQGAIDNMKRILNELGEDYGNVKFMAINPKQTKGWGKLNRVVNAYLRMRYIIKNFHAQKNVGDFFYNYSIDWALPFINRLLKRKKDMRVFCLCHNDMELYLGTDTIQGPMTKITRMVYKYSFNHLNLCSRLKLIVLGDYMIDNIRHMLKPCNVDNFASIDHAYVRPEKEHQIKKIINDKNIKIGIPSFLSPARGLDIVNKVVGGLEDVKGVSVYTLSVVAGDIVKNDNLHIMNESQNLMPIDDYVDYCAQMDYFLILYPVGSYKMTASGSVLEAIWQCKPMIALGNEYIKYIEKKYGEIGFICNDTNEIVSSIMNTNKLLDKSVLYTKNLLAIKKLLQPNMIINDFWRILAS